MRTRVPAVRRRGSFPWSGPMKEPDSSAGLALRQAGLTCGAGRPCRAPLQKESMNSEFQRLIQQATRLTRRGELQAATETIRRALCQTEVRADDAVLDVEAREVGDAAAPVLPSGDPQPSHAGGAAPRAEAPWPRGPEPASGAFAAGRYGGAGLAGRDYKLFIPPGAAAAARPMPAGRCGFPLTWRPACTPGSAARTPCPPAPRP